MGQIPGAQNGDIVEHNIYMDTNKSVFNRAGTAGFTFTTSGVTITGSGGGTFPNGTAALPSINFVGATTTGFYRPAADVLGIAIAAVAGLAIAGSSPTLAAATDTAGQDVYIKAAAAGGTATAARVGGLLNIAAGAGSAGSSGTGTVDSGTGGALALVAGAGGSATSTAGAQGGVGGAASFTAGAGGSAAGTDPGGAGGAVSVVAGAGGAKSGTGAAAGGAGGATSLTGGAGGATASSGTDAGGAGGTVTIAGGAGGAASAGTGNGGAGGSVNLSGGAGGTSAGGTAGVRGTVGVAGLRCLSNTSAAITAATTLIPADSGGVFNITPAGGATYAITLPSPTTAGLAYDFYYLASVAQTVTIAAGGATFLGTLNDAGTPAAISGTTITLEASGDIGNYVRVRSDGTRYWTEALCVTTNKINVA